ncbi:hypothetical protein [Microbacterium hominis]|uniref:hypothetical protein n=1 Tax=Microbacterium hominis TaxID=162426 RepID=UPI001F05D664|nr:hypothetical protein [Microbacterium hominis]
MASTWLWGIARTEAKPVLAATPTDGGEEVSYAQVMAAMPVEVKTIMGSPAAIGWDLLLIGTGVVSGGVASLLSLLLD